ncbi:Protein of unknown function [Cotesia congregata]|uniref:Integrase core domain-containing protein n=1 Tax=Cotesia congregata TaxID=51543 RepID=A0A8J2HRM1_COTCN|nr:Protein of unknown function [Cotesia congregata]
MPEIQSNQLIMNMLISETIRQLLICTRRLEKFTMLENLIKQYFHENYTIIQIRELLLNKHGISKSISTIKRILSALGLKRKYFKESKMEDIISAIIEEVHSCGYNLGYRSLWSLLQTCLRSKHSDKLAGNGSFIQGKSVQNQRIESYWGRMRQHTVDFYIQLFKSIQSKGLFDGSNFHIKCLQFCFGPLLKHGLDYNRRLWNEHRIRKQAARNLVAGRPNALFNLPHQHQCRDFKKLTNKNTVERLMDRFTKKPQLLDPIITELVELLVPDVKTPTNPKEALNLYKNILEAYATHRNTN